MVTKEEFKRRALWIAPTQSRGDAVVELARRSPWSFGDGDKSFDCVRAGTVTHVAFFEEEEGGKPFFMMSLDMPHPQMMPGVTLNLPRIQIYEP